MFPCNLNPDCRFLPGHFGPCAPEGQPMDHEIPEVETVADLTVRHIGQRVHVGTRHGATNGILSGIQHEADTVQDMQSNGKSHTLVGHIKSTLTMAGFGSFTVRPEDPASVVTE